MPEMAEPVVEEESKEKTERTINATLSEVDRFAKFKIMFSEKIKVEDLELVEDDIEIKLLYNYF